MRLKLYLIGVVTSLTIFFSASICTAQITFSDVAFANGITEGYGIGGYGAVFGGGVSFYDFDNDGWDDLTFASKDGDSIYFYKNVYGTFQKITPSLVSNTSEVKQILWCDYDNDGDNDLFLTANFQSNKLYENTGNLNLIDVTLSSGIGSDTDPTYSANWFDFNKDGLLDLYVCNRSTIANYYSNQLFKNNGAGNFSDVTLSANVPDSSQAVFASVVFDFNNDQYPDIYTVSDHYTLNSLYQNNGNETFTEVGAANGAGIGMEAMGVTSGDYNNDGFLDLYIANTPVGNKLLLNDGVGGFNELAISSGVSFNGLAWGVQFFDYDLDMDLDIYCSGEMQPSQGLISSALYQNIGSGNFSLITGNGMDADTLKSYGNAIGDINNDGYPDLAVNNGSWVINGDTTISAFQVWENSGTNANNFLKLKLQGTQSNRNAIGSWIELYTDSIKQVRYTTCGESYISQNSSSVFFGLGTAGIIDSLIITWPSNEVEKFYAIVPNQSLKFIEGNSVPVGSSFTDITDLTNIVHSHGNIPSFGGGLSMVDLNKDNRDDLSMSSDLNNDVGIYFNSPNLTFSNENLFVGLAKPTDSKNIIWADIDNDGDRDAFVATYGQMNQLFENNGSPFTDITAAAGLTTANTWTFASCWGDYNLDGYIDLYVTNSRYAGATNIRNFLYKNNGDGTFQDVTIAAGVTDSMNLPLAVSFIDYDNDSWPDIYIAIDKHEGNVLFHNNGDGTFTDVSDTSGADVELDGMCTAAGDYDGDGDLDIFITNSFATGMV